MTYTARLAAAKLVLDDLGVPPEADGWSVDVWGVTLHRWAAPLVRRAGGTVGDWYDRADGSRQRNIVVMMHGVEVTGLEVEVTR